MTELEADLVGGSLDKQRIVAISRRRFSSRTVLRGRINSWRGRALSISMLAKQAGDHRSRPLTQLAAINQQQQPIQVIAYILRCHRELCLRQQLAELLLRNRDLLGTAFCHSHSRKIVGRQSLKTEAAFPAFTCKRFFVGDEADLGAVRQRTKDVLQLAGTNGDRSISSPFAPCVLVVIWISISVASRVSKSPFFSSSTLERIGSV